MDTTLQYFITANWLLVLIAVFYRLVLSRLTKFQWNRRFLVLGSMAAFVLPLVELPALRGTLDGVSVTALLPEVIVSATPAEASSSFSWFTLAT